MMKTDKKTNISQAHGVLVLNKPSGPSSAKCLSGIKRLGQKKIGHAGTLDPMASGVLLVLLGHATKISGHLLSDGGKVYKGCLRIGQQTDTWDAEGNIIAESAWQDIEPKQVQEAMQAWLGKLEQQVPPYSAAKHQGKPLYKLARLGHKTPEKFKTIEISRVEVLDIALPYASFRVECSSGTYIRSLAHSLGMRLGCGAVLTELTREYSHPFSLDMAHDLESVCTRPECLQDLVMPINKALPHWSLLNLTKQEETQVLNGIPIAFRPACTQNGVNLVVEPSAHANESNKIILLGEGETPLALAQLSQMHGKWYWSILRGLWS